MERARLGRMSLALQSFSGGSRSQSRVFFDFFLVFVHPYRSGAIVSTLTSTNPDARSHAASP